MEFDDIFELLESVRLYRLRSKECLVVLPSTTGVDLGFATADGDFPSVTWTMPVRKAKATALARGTREASRIRELLASAAGRKQLLDELRAGSLEYGISRPPVHVEAPEKPSPQQGSRQIQLPL